jgi:hypothetical protein
MYIGIPIDTDEETKQTMIDTVNERHPESTLVAIVDGYWSGVEESTLLIKVESTEEFARETTAIIKVLLDDGFVALDEVDD